MATQGEIFSASPAPGVVIGGKYRLVKRLSEGGVGVVWEAANPNDHPIALKFLKWTHLKSRKFATERFKNEFAILKSLSHPNISQIYDFGHDPAADLYYFTTELLTAGDLKTVIGAPVPVLERLLLQALRALEYLRGNKLLHLDIKPQNLLLRHNGETPSLAVIDFGLAAFRPPDFPGGTANYMPPEMIVRRLEMDETMHDYPPPDHRSDLYSLGVTFYYCLTGTQPFCEFTLDNKIDPAGTFERHLEYTPPPPSSIRLQVPPYLDRIIMKLIARHPNDRYPSAIIAAQALQYASPEPHAPESTQTLLSYLPKEGKLIGRHAEHQIIEDALKGISAGTPHIAPVICIAGRHGTGRTRLLMAAKPFAQQLEMNVTAIEQGDPGAAAIEGVVSSHESSDGAQNNLVLIDDLDRLLKDANDSEPEMNGKGPEDSAGTLSGIRSLVMKLRLQQRLKDVPGPRTCMIFTLNEERFDLNRAMAELDLDDSFCRTITLENFTTEEISEYLTTLLGETPDSTIVDELKSCTEGNPLFITEHLEEMIARGMLFSLAGRPDAKTLKTIGIDFSQTSPPRSLADDISRRLSLLGGEARSLALLMACFGRPVSAEELKETFGSRTTYHELLLLVSAGIVRRDIKDGRFSFVNALTSRVICDQTNPEVLGHRHDSIARYLMCQRRVNKDELDLHMAYGSRTEKRLPSLRRISDKAVEDGQYLEAARHLETLLRLVPHKDSRERAEILSKLGASYEKARRPDDARSAYLKLKQLKAPPDLKTQFRTRATERLGLMALRRRELANARKFFNEAIELVRNSHAMLLSRIRLENCLASVDLRDGRVEDAVERFERTAKVAERKLGDGDRRKITNNELGEALLMSGEARRAIRILGQELSAAGHASDLERMANRHYLLGDALRHDEIQNYGAAHEHYHQALKIARTHRMVELQVRILNGMGNLNLKTSRPDIALENYREGLKLAQQIEGETTSVELMIGMGLAAQQMQRPDNTIEYFEAALDFSKGPRGACAGLIRRYNPAIYVSLGDAYYQKRDLEKAEHYLREALAIDKKKPLTPDIRYSLYGTFVEIYLEKGELSAAMKYIPLLKTIARSYPPAKYHFEKLSERVHYRSTMAQATSP